MLSDKKNDYEQTQSAISREIYKKIEDVLKKHNLKPEKRLIERFLHNISPIVDILNDRLLESLVIENLTIGESYFFRDMQTFEKLRKILPKKSFWNILSVGCSKGEEVYTTAIVAKESGVDFKITGIDVNHQRIIQAQKGCYRFWSVRFLNESDIVKYFNIVNGEYCIKDEYKNNVKFVVGNILDKGIVFEKQEKFDIIFVRRVLLYIEQYERAVKKLSDLLKDDGYMILGAGEYHPNVFEYFTPAFSDTGAIFRKIKSHEREKEEIQKVRDTQLNKKTFKEIVNPSKNHTSPHESSESALSINKFKIAKTIKTSIESASFEEKIAIIEELISQKKYKEAYENIKEVSAEYKTNYIIWKYRVLVELELSIIDEAKQSLKNALFLNSSDDEIWQLKHAIDFHTKNTERHNLS